MRFSLIVAVFAAAVSAFPRAQGTPDFASILEGLKSGGGLKGAGGASGGASGGKFPSYFLRDINPIFPSSQSHIITSKV
jgi:hypothetical protein